MSFVDELHAEEEAKRKETAKKDAFDRELLEDVINAVKEYCHHIIQCCRGHIINGYYTLDDYHEGCFLGHCKSDIPDLYCSDYNCCDQSFRLSAYELNNPMLFEKLLNFELKNLGFKAYDSSSLCTLIPRQVQKCLGYSYTSNYACKYDFRPTGKILYTIWVSISW